MGDARSNWLGGLRGTKLRRVFFFFFFLNNVVMREMEYIYMIRWLSDTSSLIYFNMIMFVVCLIFSENKNYITHIFLAERFIFFQNKTMMGKKKLFHFIWQLSKHILRIKFLDFDPGIRSSLDCKAFTFATQAIPTLVCNVGRPSRVRAECCSTAMQEQPQESSMICSNYSMHLCTHICIYILK